nr:AMP-binding protein [uncultured Clostridium sp.]
METEDRKDYLGLIRQIPADRTALIIDSCRYTFGMLTDQAEKLRFKEGLTWGEGKTIRVIQTLKIEEQLITFLALSGTQVVPVIVPADVKMKETLLQTEVPGEACMVVMTSGTTGENKLLFRTLGSWQGYFHIQNEIFGMGDGSRIFMHGSLAFTGNLNLYLAQLTAGGSIVAANTSDPRNWMKEIEDWKADTVYLIPAKLRLLKKVYDRKAWVNSWVRNIISGSQSLGKHEAEALKQVFKNASVILYYGASELNYITYVKDFQMGEDKTLVGSPFPEVQLHVENGEIRVSTRYGVIGTKEEEWIGDCGHIDQNGLLCFDGRKDGICNVNGRKVMSAKIENELAGCPGIAEAAVKSLKRGGQDILAAWIVPEEQGKTDMLQVRKYLKASLCEWEIPKAVFFVEELPKSESGKLLKRNLKDLNCKKSKTS